MRWWTSDSYSRKVSIYRRRRLLTYMTGAVRGGKEEAVATNGVPRLIDDAQFGRLMLQQE